MSDNFLNGLLGGLGGKDGNNLLLLVLLLFLFSNGNILGDLFGGQTEPEPPGRRRPY
ncbi:hypothetical protein R9X47_03125 [Wukongibacter baidiensis]|uniref:hypothetical protein n=1 Tax=Wukongibacter baidiensis TaxID=1723361 RepID=UPI003D7FA628